VVQETYLRTYRSIGRFRGDAQFSTWLYRITANCAASVSARSARHRHAELGPRHRYSILRADHDPAQHVDASTLRARLELAIAELPPRLRQVIVLRDVYELPHDQIAAELGISESRPRFASIGPDGCCATGSFREINAMPYESRRCADIVQRNARRDQRRVAGPIVTTSSSAPDCRRELEAQRADRSVDPGAASSAHRAARTICWRSSTQICAVARRRPSYGWLGWSRVAPYVVGCWRLVPGGRCLPVVPGAPASGIVWPTRSTAAPGNSTAGRRTALLSSIVTP
jgi:RNA polymerase sigma factor (sigma-70 family)